MGHPKKLRKKYDTPKKPYDKERLEEEKMLMKSFGLKKKQEIWRAESRLRNYRRRAREIQTEKSKEKEKILVDKACKIGLIAPNSSLDDILGLKVENLLERRLQTQVFRRGFSRTIKQARQLIVHGHVSVNGRKVWWPSYIVKVDEEDKIEVEQPQNPIEKKPVKKITSTKEGENGE